MGSTGAVRRISIGKRRGVLEYTVFTKDEKPVARNRGIVRPTGHPRTHQPEP